MRIFNADFMLHWCDATCTECGSAVRIWKRADWDTERADLRWKCDRCGAHREYSRVLDESEARATGRYP